MRVHAFCYITCLWEFMLFGALLDLLMRFHAFSPLLDFRRFLYEFSCFMRFRRDFMRFSCDISCFLRASWEFLVRFVAVCCIVFSWDFLMRLHAYCSAIFIWDFVGRCVVLCVQVGWFVGGGNECKCECVGRQKGLCGSCLIRVTSMHGIKSIRVCLRVT